jgi:hypothetical protein
MIGRIFNVAVGVFFALVGGTLGGILILFLWNGFTLPYAGYDGPSATFLGPLEAVAGYKISEAYLEWRDDAGAIDVVAWIMLAFGMLSSIGEILAVSIGHQTLNWWRIVGAGEFALCWLGALVFVLSSHRQAHT